MKMHFVIVGILVCLLAGCNVFKPRTTPRGFNAPQAGMMHNMETVQNVEAVQNQEMPVMPQEEAVITPPVVTPPVEPLATYYYDFNDILIPKEMILDSHKSLLFETPQIKAGLLCFSGRFNAVSLFNFFRSNMINDGWHERSYFKYGRFIIVFEKPNKDCIMSISEDGRNTDLEIWITPHVNKVSLPPRK